MKTSHFISKLSSESVAAALIIATGLYAVFLALEPVVGGAQASDQFEISQVVTDEIAFVVNANNVTLSPALSGITGGTSNGSAFVRVRTNAAAGYNMTLVASSSPAMQGETQGDTIADHTYGTPTFALTTTEVADSPGQAFAFSVEASTTADTAPAFQDNGTTCGAGGANAVDSCWQGASTTAVTIINRSSATAASGATTTLKFRVVIDPNATDATAEDTYTATTTLTATNN